MPGDFGEGVVGVEVLVGGDEHVSAGTQDPREQVEVGGADEAPLRVLLLAPRVGEEEVDRLEGVVGDTLLQEEHGIADLHPQVRHSRLLGVGEHPRESGSVHVHGDEVMLREGGGIRDGGVAVAAPDLEHHRSDATEGLRCVEATFRQGP